MRVLNSKEKKQLFQNLHSTYGYEGSLDYEIVANKKQKYYVIAPGVQEAIPEHARVETLGMYFGQQMPEGAVRLSIEGSQLIGPSATRGVLFLNREQYHEWARGRDIMLEGDEDGWMIACYEHENGDHDYHGCGKVVRKQEHGKEVTLLHNYVPKTRYVRSED